MPDHQGAEQHQRAGERSQGYHSRPQVPDKSVSVLNLDQVLDHSLLVHFTLHCLHCLTGVKARIRPGGSDDETLAERSVSGAGREDAVREAPADREVCLRGTWEELRHPDGEVDEGGFVFH